MLKTCWNYNISLQIMQPLISCHPLSGSPNLRTPETILIYWVSF